MNIEGGGYTTEIGKAALEKAGYTVIIKFAPWARVLEMTQAGKYDGIFGIYYSEERSQTLVFTDPMAQTEQVFLIKKDRKIMYTGDLHELILYKIGIVRRHTFPQEFEKADFLKKEEVIEPRQNIEKLMNNRIDLFVESKHIAYYLVKTQFPEYIGSFKQLSPALMKTSDACIYHYNCNLCIFFQCSFFQSES